jgi:hypothetical protein
VEGGPAPL